MSVLVIKVKNEENISLLKRLISVFNEKVKVYEEEEYRDKKFAELAAEGMKTRTLSKEDARAELKKRGIRIK